MCLHPHPTSSVISQRATFPYLRNSGTSSSPPRATASPSPLSFPTLSTLPPPHHLPPPHPFTNTSDISTPLSSTSALSDGSSFPRKRRHEESSEHDSRPTASTGPKVMCRGPSSPLAVHSSTPVIPQRIRLNLALDATSTEPSLPSQQKLRHFSPSSSRHPTLRMSRCATRARSPRCSISCRPSSRPTGTCATRTRTTACSRPKASSASLRSAGSRLLKSVRTLALSSLPSSRSTMTYRTNGDTRSSCRRTKRMPTPSRRVQMRRKAVLTGHRDDYPDSKFFGCGPIGYSDDEDEDAPPSSPPRSGSKARAVTEAKPELAEPKGKWRKVRGTTNSRIQGKPGALRREFSHPQV